MADEHTWRRRVVWAMLAGFAVCVLVAGLWAGLWVHHALRIAKVALTAEDMVQISREAEHLAATEKLQLTTGEQVIALVRRAAEGLGNQPVTDRWGREVEIHAERGDRRWKVTFLSPGRDGRLRTEDDLEMVEELWSPGEDAPE